MERSRSPDFTDKLIILADILGALGVNERCSLGLDPDAARAIHRDHENLTALAAAAADVAVALGWRGEEYSVARGNKPAHPQTLGFIGRLVSAHTSFLADLGLSNGQAQAYTNRSIADYFAIKPCTPAHYCDGIRMFAAGHSPGFIAEQLRCRVRGLGATRSGFLRVLSREEHSSPYHPRRVFPTYLTPRQRSEWQNFTQDNPLIPR